MRILVIEDEATLREGLRRQLAQNGFMVEVAGDGEEGLFAATEYDLDVAIVDLGLPKLPGMEVIRRMRDKGRKFPILVLTAKSSWQDKVAGFRAGADDYVVKPVVFEEILIRLQALVRRANGWASPEITCGPVVMDTYRRTVTVGGSPVSLSNYQMRILELLMMRAGKVVSKQELTGAHVRRGPRTAKQRHRVPRRAVTKKARSVRPAQSHRNGTRLRISLHGAA